MQPTTLNTAEKARAHYRLLEVPECSPLDVVRRKYRELALRLHPDKNLDDPFAVERFQAINVAYEVLSNAEKKKVFDDALVAAQVTLHQPSTLHGAAAAMLQKQNSKLFDELRSFRMQRRAQSQHSGSRGPNGASVDGENQRPSQYSKEQTEYFRMREKEREREMKRKLEKERETQRELELERYRMQQQERMKEDERRSKEARARLARMEEAILSSNQSATSKLHKTTSGLGLSPIATSTPRGMRREVDTVSLNSNASTTTRSPSMPATIVVQSSSFVSNGSGEFHSPLAHARSPVSASSPVAHQHSTPGTGRRLGNQVLASSASPRHISGSTDAADERVTWFQQEMRLLVDCERGERQQYLEQEEELERRILFAAIRKELYLMNSQERYAALGIRETRVREAVVFEEMSAFSMLALLSEHHGVRADMIQEALSARRAMELIFHQRIEDMQLSEMSRERLLQEERTRRLTLQCDGLGTSLLMHIETVDEPLYRHRIACEASLACGAAGTAASVYLAFYWLEQAARSQIGQETARQWHSMILVSTEDAKRIAIIDDEASAYMTLIKARGRHRHAVWHRCEERLIDRLEVQKMQHDAEVARLLQELSHLRLVVQSCQSQPVRPATSQRTSPLDVPLPTMEQSRDEEGPITTLVKDEVDDVDEDAPVVVPVVSSWSSANALRLRMPPPLPTPLSGHVDKLVSPRAATITGGSESAAGIVVVGEEHASPVHSVPSSTSPKGASSPGTSTWSQEGYVASSVAMKGHSGHCSGKLSAPYYSTPVLRTRSWGSGVTDGTSAKAPPPLAACLSTPPPDTHKVLHKRLSNQVDVPLA